MGKETKFFRFEHSEGADIMVAEFGSQAIKHYLDYYMDNSQVDDILMFGGLKVEELTIEEINEKRNILNEEKGIRESVSYLEIYEQENITLPCIIVTPNY